MRSLEAGKNCLETSLCSYPRLQKYTYFSVGGGISADIFVNELSYCQTIHCGILFEPRLEKTNILCRKEV